METNEILQAFVCLIETPETQLTEAEPAIQVLIEAARQGMIREAIEAIARYN